MPASDQLPENPPNYQLVLVCWAQTPLIKGEAGCHPVHEGIQNNEVTAKAEPEQQFVDVAQHEIADGLKGVVVKIPKQGD